MFPQPLATRAARAVDAWLATATANPGALRYVREGRAECARALAAQAKDAELSRRPPERVPRCAGLCVLVRPGVRMLGGAGVLGELGMPRRRPPTRSPSANRLIVATASST